MTRKWKEEHMVTCISCPHFYRTTGINSCATFGIQPLDISFSGVKDEGELGAYTALQAKHLPPPFQQKHLLFLIPNSCQAAINYTNVWIISKKQVGHGFKC
jgi:hypothetical protein